MDKLPRELLHSILLARIQDCRCQKNSILPLRLVCRDFDDYLKPIVFQTLQLEFSRFERNTQAPTLEYARSVGHLTRAIYCDMMIVRDDDEITRLQSVFSSIISKVPEMDPLLRRLRRYCMSEDTFDETDFRRVFGGVVDATPKLDRLKMNLPFQVIGRVSQTGTLLLATAFACLAARPSEYSPLRTLVLDHVSDSTVLDICRNPIDLHNAVQSLKDLHNLVLSFKQQESGSAARNLFANHFWMLINAAPHLETLCLVGWNTRNSSSTRRTWTTSSSQSFAEWTMKSLPFPPAEQQRASLRFVRRLELKRVDVDPLTLMAVLTQSSMTLRELYLDEVYLKLFDYNDVDDVLWIGRGAAAARRPRECRWIAEQLRDMQWLHLDVLRVTGLGYNDFNPDAERRLQNYDLDDPTDLGRSFDQRFVEVAMGIAQPASREEIAEQEARAQVLAARTANSLPYGYLVAGEEDEDEDMDDVEESNGGVTDGEKSADSVEAAGESNHAAAGITSPAPAAAIPQTVTVTVWGQPIVVPAPSTSSVYLSGGAANTDTSTAVQSSNSTTSASYPHDLQISTLPAPSSSSAAPVPTLSNLSTSSTMTTTMTTTPTTTINTATKQTLSSSSLSSSPPPPSALSSTLSIPQSQEAQSQQAQSQQAHSQPQTPVAVAVATTTTPAPLRHKSEWDVEAHQRRSGNTTSHWKRSLDGHFNNPTERALKELHSIVQVADRGMTLLSREIEEAHGLEM